MRLDDLLAQYQGKAIAIHTGEEYFADCLTWLQSQDVKWINGRSLNDETFFANKEAFYEEYHCFVVDHKKLIYRGDCRVLSQHECYIVEYEDLFREQLVDFTDLDAILSERSQP